MANFRFHQISNTKKIRHISKIFKDSSFIVFLHGFMSDLEGKKPNAFLKFAKKNKVSFLALEYSGHGKSSGKFVNGNISKWSKETTILIRKYVKKKEFVLIGSSMGAWISLNQFKIFKKQIKGFLLCTGSLISLTFFLSINFVNSPPLVTMKDAHPFSGK